MFVVEAGGFEPPSYTHSLQCPEGLSFDFLHTSVFLIHDQLQNRREIEFIDCRIASIGAQPIDDHFRLRPCPVHRNDFGPRCRRVPVFDAQHGRPQPL